MIAGNFNPSTMATNLHFLYHPLPQIKFETKAQTGAFPNASVFRNSVGSLELLGQSSTISLTFYNPKRDSGRMTIGFLHSFNDKLCAGAELLTAWSDRDQVKASVALAGRFVVVLFNWKDRWGCVGKRYKRHFNEPLNFRFCRTHGSLAFFLSCVEAPFPCLPYQLHSNCSMALSLCVESSSKKKKATQFFRVPLICYQFPFHIHTHRLSADTPSTTAPSHRRYQRTH